VTEISILKDLVIILGLSVASLLVCHRLHLPPLIGFLVAGIVVGPYGLGLIRSVHDVEVLAEIGIVFLLFAIGIEFSLRDLLRSRRAVLLGGGLQVAATILVVYLLISQFGRSQSEALFVGFLVALSSTAIVLRALQDRGEIHSAHGRTILSILIFQDIAIAPMIIIVPLLSGEADSAAGPLAMLALKALAVVVMVIILAHYVVPRILELVVRTRSRELFLLSAILICVAIAWGTSELGLSLGLGAFLAGLMISESEYSHQVLDGIVPFKMVFTGFFFVSVGMLLNISFAVSQPVLVICISLGVMIVKAMVAGGVALSLGMSSRSAIIVALAISQVGEFSFILSRVGVSFGLLDQETYQLFLAVSITSMAVTPFMINLAPRLADRVSQMPLMRLFQGGAYLKLSEADPSSEVLKDHLLIIGFGINGRNIAHAARSAQIPYCVIEMNPDTVKSMRRSGEPIFYGDATSHSVLENVSASSARVVVIAISDPAATRSITQNLHRINPSAYIIVRTRFVKEVEPLMDLGAAEVIPEEFETSVEIFTRVLMKYMVPREDIDRFISEIRSQSYQMLRGLSQRSSRLADLQLHFPEIEISTIRLSANCPHIGQSLAGAELRTRYAITVLAIMRADNLLVHPEGSELLIEGDILYVIGSADQCSTANRLLSTGKSQ